MEVCDVVAAFKKQKKIPKQNKKTPLHVLFIFVFLLLELDQLVSSSPANAFCFFKCLLYVFFFFFFFTIWPCFSQKNGRTKRQKKKYIKKPNNNNNNKSFLLLLSSPFRLRLLLLSFRTSQSAVFAAPVYVYSTLS
jgi:hypothetical protein